MLMLLRFRRSGSGRPITAAALLATLASGGCYAHAPLAMESAEPAQEVRVELTEAGEVRVRRLMELEGPTLSGRVVEVGRESLLVEVPIGMRRDHLHSRVVYQPLELRREELARLELRRLDHARSAGVAAVLAIGVASVIRMMGGEGYGTGTTQPVDPAPKATIPVP